MEAVKSNRSITSRRTEPVKPNACLNRAFRKGITKEAQQRSFLNYRFDELPILDVAPLTSICLGFEDGKHLNLGNVEIDLVKNLTKLRKSAEAYCRTHNGSVSVNTDNPIRELQKLYQAVRECCPLNNEIEINYFEETKELSFVELAYAPYPDSSVAFISVKFLDYLPAEYRQFFLELLSLIRVTLQVPFPEDHYDFAYTTGYFDDEYLEDVMTEDPEYAETVKSYRTGDAKRLFDEILNTPWQNLGSNPKITAERITTLEAKASSPELKELIVVAKHGIALLVNENINTYRYNLGYCSIPEFEDYEYQDELCGFDRVMAFCYGDENDDPVVMRTLDSLNNDAGNYIQEELYEPHLITSDYDKPFESSNFPQKWFDWYVEFYNARVKYEQAYKNNVGSI